MCGIAGYLSRAARPADEMKTLAGRMADVLARRGPDSSGVWVDPGAGLAFGHRRLAIVDLSEAGSQPMVSACGRFVIVLNGEIYNHLELRERLDGEGNAPPWRGHSDTETLLAGIAAWGLDAALQRSVGMFALALWDRQRQQLLLARDRFGEKPLYYGWAGDGAARSFVFGSELKALRAFPGFAGTISLDALQQYFQFLYVPAPWSIYEEARKLEAGHILALDASALQAGGWPASRAYWDLPAAMEAAAADRLVDEAGALQAVEDALRGAVRLQMLADVPVGAFLSGGVDSSLITALMQQESGGRSRSFTIGFEEAGFDESPHARAIARHLGTEHTEMFVTAAEARAVVPELATIYDEPFADSSQIPTHLVCRAAREHVTVVLSGDGGDELFGGYNRYFWLPGLWKRLSVLPFPLRRQLGKAIEFLPARRWNQVGDAVNRSRRGARGVDRLGSKAHKLAAGLRRSRNVEDMYLSLVSAWPEPARLVRADAQSPAPPSALRPAYPGGVDHLGERMMYRDLRSYMTDDILCKVDRAAMACSLETRTPFLDHRVAETAWRLPVAMKLRGTTGKWALRQVLYKYVPRELIERPKAGFAVPLGAWLRGPLRGWAEALIEPARLRREGYLRPEPVQELWAEHLAGRSDRSAELWSVLVFQEWLDKVH